MNAASVPRLKQLGLNGLAGQETQGQRRSPTETATGRLGAIPAIRQVLADLRGALPGDHRKSETNTDGKSEYKLELPLPQKTSGGRGAIGWNCIHE